MRQVRCPAGVPSAAARARRRAASQVCLLRLLPLVLHYLAAMGLTLSAQCMPLQSAGAWARVEVVVSDMAVARATEKAVATAAAAAVAVVSVNVSVAALVEALVVVVAEMEGRCHDS